VANHPEQVAVVPDSSVAFVSATARTKLPQLICGDAF